MARRKLNQELHDIAVRLHIELRRHRIWADMIILFGSFASGQQRKDSDIDLAVVSRHFGKDKLMEGAKLNRIAVKVDNRIEALSFSLREYFDPKNISPVLYEIKKKGICLV